MVGSTVEVVTCLVVLTVLSLILVDVSLSGGIMVTICIFVEAVSLSLDVVLCSSAVVSSIFVVVKPVAVFD